MTIKLYEQEGYQTTFHAHVVSCIKKNELYDIILDQTLFFPEEGGQTCDKGTLNGIEVVDVQIINCIFPFNYFRLDARKPHVFVYFSPLFTSLSEIHYGNESFCIREPLIPIFHNLF